MLLLGKLTFCSSCWLRKSVIVVFKLCCVLNEALSSLLSLGSLICPCIYWTSRLYPLYVHSPLSSSSPSLYFAWHVCYWLARQICFSIHRVCYYHLRPGVSCRAISIFFYEIPEYHWLFICFLSVFFIQLGYRQFILFKLYMWLPSSNTQVKFRPVNNSIM